MMRCPTCGRNLSSVVGTGRYYCAGCGYRKTISREKLAELKRRYDYRTPASRIGFLFGRKSV